MFSRYVAMAECHFSAINNRLTKEGSHGYKVSKTPTLYPGYKMAILGAEGSSKSRRRYSPEDASMH